MSTHKGGMDGKPSGVATCTCQRLPCTPAAGLRRIFAGSIAREALAEAQPIRIELSYLSQQCATN
jgi:hypothetical protein